MPHSDRPTDTRSRIVAVAAELLQREGPAAVTTRGVAEGAGVQAPTIYRLFGDKNGLLEAVAEHVMATYVSAKADIVAAAAAENIDPVDELRAGWTQQIDFGLANPALFRLMGDPERAVRSPAAQSGKKVLESRIRRVAETGRLRVSERRAVDLVQAAGVGVIQTLLATPPDDRDRTLPDAIFDAVLAQILDDDTARESDPRLPAAVALRAVAPHLDMLTTGEQGMLAEWCDRAIAALSGCA